MKLLAFAILVVVISIFSTSLVQGSPNIPSFDQVTQIGLFSYKGWTLDINPDGSGNLVYGSSFGDNARIPKQTFSFQDVYNLLVPHLSDTYKEGKSVAVTLHVAGQNSSISLYLDDKATIKKIMSDARDKAVPLDRARFKELLAKHPPVPDDTPSTSQ